MEPPAPSPPPPPKPHVLLFPFMSKGHTIPLLSLGRLILLHRPQATAVTIFITPANRPFIADSLSDLITASSISIVDLPFPDDHIPGVPSGIESTDKLPSMSLFLPFVTSTKLLQSRFEAKLQSLIENYSDDDYFTFLVSDGFLHWTQESAAKFNIPRLVFYGMNNYSTTMVTIVGRDGLLSGPEPDEEPVPVPQFPWISVTRNHFSYPFNMREPAGPHFDFIMEMASATAMSFGVVANSFYEIEPRFVDYWNENIGPKSWCIGPLCWAEKGEDVRESRPGYFDWLDQKRLYGKEVLYIAFGTQAELTDEQLRVIALGLERSEVEFLWAVRGKREQEEIINEFEDRVVKGEKRGTLVRDWVDQKGILNHESMTGFLSHCGWNSVLESVCAGVPILGWPVMAEQHLNAKMVVEEMGVGVRVETCDGSVKGFVNWDGLERNVRDLMDGEEGKKARAKAKEMSVIAKRAVQPGGSSWNSLELLLHELHVKCTTQRD